MTEAQRIQNLELKFDRVQHQLHELTARVEKLITDMNAFTAEAQAQLVELLQKQGQQITITESKEKPQA
jgi:outer membrane murein-binding lipoprotein Lpp